MTVRFVKLRDNAILPFRGSEKSIGYDLSFAPEDGQSVRFYPGNQFGARTGLAVGFPEGYWGQIVARSGLAFRHGVTVLCGIIDPDYTGELSVVLQNTGKEPILVEPGDRVGQLILHRIAPPFEPVWVDSLEATQRGSNGFGSTGVATKG